MCGLSMEKSGFAHVNEMVHMDMANEMFLNVCCK